MNEINNSRLLAFIIDRAKQAPGSSVGLTASRYLLSLLEVYVGATEYRLMPEERGKLQAILAQGQELRGRAGIPLRLHRRQGQ